MSRASSFGQSHFVSSRVNVRNVLLGKYIPKLLEHLLEYQALALGDPIAKVLQPQLLLTPTFAAHELTPLSRLATQKVGNLRWQSAELGEHSPSVGSSKHQMTL